MLMMGLGFFFMSGAALIANQRFAHIVYLVCAFVSIGYGGGFFR